MKKLLVVLSILLLSSVSAATWVAADKVAPVGKNIITKNGLFADTTFKVVKVLLTILHIQLRMLFRFQALI